VVEGEVDDDAGVTPEGGRELLAQQGPLRQGIDVLVDVAVQQDSFASHGGHLGVFRIAADEIPQHGAEAQAVVITGQQQVGEEIHAANLNR
jgi:predicted TIM-barrel enzyme